jgi:hypothetical protein
MPMISLPLRSAASTRRWTAPLVAAAVALAACHPPRDPRGVSESPVTGAWKARSAAVGEPADTGEVAWRLTLEEEAAGKVDGRGTRAHGGASSTFELTGQRGESEITLQFILRGEEVTYHGSILGHKTIVGEMLTPRDTIAVSFTRE